MSKKSTIARLKRVIKDLENNRGRKRKMRSLRQKTETVQSMRDDFFYQAGEIELHYQNTGYYEGA